MALDSGLGGECGEEGDPNLWEQTDCGLPEPMQAGHRQVKIAILGAPGTTLSAEARVCRARKGLWVGSPCTLATCQQVRLQL